MADAVCVCVPCCGVLGRAGAGGEGEIAARGTEGRAPRGARWSLFSSENPKESRGTTTRRPLGRFSTAQHAVQSAFSHRGGEIRSIPKD